MKKSKQMRKTTIWYNRKITLDEDKYYYRELSNPEGYLEIIDKETNNKVFGMSCPGFILQVNDNTFITTDWMNEDTYKFQCLQYKNEFGKSSIKTIYEKYYKPMNIIDGSVDIINNVAIIRSWLDITIYNYKENKALTIEGLNIISKIQEDNKDYLLATIEIEDAKDYLTLGIDMDTLEFSGFYSRMQDRFIPIIRNYKSPFLDNFNITLQKEIVKYIENFEKERDKRAIETVKKTLRKK